MNGSLSPTPVRSSRRRGLRAGLLLGLAVLLSGCLKYDLALIVNEDDTMDGTLIVAVAREFAVGEDVFGQSGELTPSQGSVTKEAYEDADYIGSRYVISGVPISEIDALATDNSTRFSLTHEGDEYVLDASLNFNLGGSDSIPTDGSFTAMVAMTFPGAVLESNGTIDGNSVVWTQLRPDAANSLTARASAVANGAAGGPFDSGTPWWVWVLGGVGLLALAALIAAIVLRKRRAAKTARAAQATVGTRPSEQQGWYDEYGTWVPAPGSEGQSSYYDSGQDDGYDSYYGTYGGSYGDSYAGGDAYDGAYGESYGGVPGPEPYPQVGQPHGGFSGQTVVSRPDDSPPPSAWSPRPR